MGVIAVGERCERVMPLLAEGFILFWYMLLGDARAVYGISAMRHRLCCSPLLVFVIE